MSRDPIVQALQPYSTCDVADALLKLNHPYGGFLSGLTLWSPKRQEGPTKVIGPAYTVKYTPKDEPSETSVKGHYIDSLPPHSILFVTAPSTPLALYGGLMSTRAAHLACAGTIVDGRIRDLQEHRNLGYPVFARDIGTTAPHALLKVGEINAPVSISIQDPNSPQPTSPTPSTTIHPGDYLIGDLNGVVCLPRSLAEKVLALIPSQVEADERIAADLRAGRAFGEASKEWRARVKGVGDL